MTQKKTACRLPHILGLVVVALVATACQGASSTPPSGVSTPSSDDVWAVVDGREILRDEVEVAFGTTVDPTVAPPSNEESVALKLDILEELITQHILLERAREQGLIAGADDVEEALNQQREALTPEVFEQQLAESGLTLEAVREGLERELSVQRLIEQEVLSQVSVTDQEIEDYYERNRGQFNLTEPQYRLARIVVTPVADPGLQNGAGSDAATPAEAEEKIQMITEQLGAGADFRELALAYSEDPQSLPQGGDLGFVPESSLVQVSPDLRDAVAGMEAGEANVVNLGGTYMMLLLLGVEPAGQRDLETPSVRDGVRDMLTGRKETLLQAAYITRARNQADVTNFLAGQVIEAAGDLRLPERPISAPATGPSAAADDE